MASWLLLALTIRGHMKLIKRVLQEKLWGYLTPALMMEIDETTLDWIAFGDVKELGILRGRKARGDRVSLHCAL